MPREQLSRFDYKYLQGPLPLHELQETIPNGNCRAAVQDYFLTMHNVYLRRDQIVLPEALHAGILIKELNQEGDFFTGLKRGDIIYGEKIRTSKGTLWKRTFDNENERMTNFHLGVYVGMLDEELVSKLPPGIEIEGNIPAIWHSSFISGGTALWTIDRFSHYYQPVLARRITV